MALTLSCGPHMQPITRHNLGGHVQCLREIFNRRFECRYGDTYQLRNIPDLIPLTVPIVLIPNSCTVEVESDRGQQETCAVLVTIGTKRILCSFLEGWRLTGRKLFEFHAAAMTFFL